MVEVNTIQPGPIDTAMSRQLFDVLWARLVGADSSQAWAALQRGYGEAGRGYHNWTHIETMLTGLQAVRGEAEFAAASFDEIELAIYFHDAVYDPRAKDNEEKSAALLMQQVGLLGPDRQPVLSRIEAMILATQTHSASDDLSTRLLLDLDLAILGAPPDLYDRYAAAIRFEYAFVPEDQWRVGRAAVLSRFLERPVIYQTDYFHSRLETAARDNLRREIDQLSA